METTQHAITVDTPPQTTNLKPLSKFNLVFPVDLPNPIITTVDTSEEAKEEVYKLNLQLAASIEFFKMLRETTFNVQVLSYKAECKECHLLDWTIKKDNKISYDFIGSSLYVDDILVQV